MLQCLVTFVPVSSSPRVLLLERDFVNQVCIYLQKLATNSVPPKAEQTLRNQVIALRAKQPEVVAFTVCTGSHHYVCVLRRGLDQVVEVLTLDSFWTGADGIQSHLWSRPKLTRD